MNNQDRLALLNYLFDNHLINVKRSSLFDLSLPPISSNLEDLWNRIEGMMLALAIGDSLGNTSESMRPHHRQKYYGEIRDYLPNRYAGGQKIGLPSDDTQLSFLTLQQMNKDRGFNPDRVAFLFSTHRIYGMGSTVREFVRNYNSGISWYQSGVKSAGNGALMRVAPMVIPHLKLGTSNLWTDTALSAMLTHNDSASIASCLAFIYIIWQLLKMEHTPQPNWWLQTYLTVAKSLEIDDRYCPRGGAFTDYCGYVWQFVLEKVPEAYRARKPVVDACNQWYSGAYLLETVPSVLYILMTYGHNLEEAIVRAVNDTKDNDTIAAIVGAVMGALHGKKKIPNRWLANLPGRISESNDGKIFEILETARHVWLGLH